MMKTLDPEKTAPFQYDRGRTGCLLIHGFTGSPNVLRELGAYLAERDLTILCRPLPGHGTTPLDMIRTGWRDWYRACVSDLLEISAKCDRVFLIGLSMGGTLSLHLAAHYADLHNVAGVVTCGAPVFMKNPLFPLLPIAGRFMKFIKTPEPDVADLSMRPEVQSYDHVPLRCVSELLNLLDHVRNDLQDVKVPALLIQGRVDHVVHPSNVHVIHGLLGSENKAIVEVDNSYHILTVDYDKELVKDKTYEFIRSIVPPE